LSLLFITKKQTADLGLGRCGGIVS